jgi:prolyl-tRNA editing enzyme YbaK/EbsC (Cys-tRNA(Pro) deacylase)
MGSEEKVAAAARELGLDVDVRAFPEGTRTAADAAAAIGCDVAQIVKSLVFVVGDEPVVALVGGADQLDPARLGAVAGGGGGGGAAVRRASAEEVRAATGFAVGGVPPFGHDTPLRCFVDDALLAHDVVWAAAGTPTHVFAVEPARLVDAAGAAVAVLRVAAGAEEA